MYYNVEFTAPTVKIKTVDDITILGRVVELRAKF